MRKGILIIGIFLFLLVYSCIKHDDPDINSGNGYLKGSGVFVLNEGNYMGGNGSLSFYSFDSATIYNDLFYRINGRPLGDIPNFMTLYDDLAFIVVNNSGKIEVTDPKTLKSVKTISGLDSPRQLLVVNDKKAYVSSLWSNRIAIIDLGSHAITGHIDIRRSSEAMIIVRNKVYVSCWSSGNDIMIIDPATDSVKDSIRVGNEPESMVVDSNDKLWVLCSGGYSGQYFPELISISTLTDKTEKVFRFESKTISPTSLCISEGGDTIYFIERGIRRMSVSDTELPASYFVPASGRLFYKLEYDRQNGGLFATNAMDYQQKGFLLRINRKGEVTDSARAGIIPAAICYNRNLN